MPLRVTSVRRPACPFNASSPRRDPSLFIIFIIVVASPASLSDRAAGGKVAESRSVVRRSSRSGSSRTCGIAQCVINAIHVDESHLQKPQQTFASLVKRDIAMGEEVADRAKVEIEVECLL